MLNTDLTKMVEVFGEDEVEGRMRNVPVYRKVVKENLEKAAILPQMER